MTFILADLRQAGRALASHPGYATLAALTLALGIGANTAIFSAVHAILLRPLPYEDPERLVWITNHVPQFSADMVGGGDYIDWRDRTRTLSAIAAYEGLGSALTLTGRGDPQRLIGARISASFLPLLGVRPLAGRPFIADDERTNAPPVVLLTARGWERLVGHGVALAGQTLTLDDRPYTVAGVLPPAFVFPGQPRLEVLLPMPLNEAVERGRRQMSIVSVLGRLAAGTTIDRARTELESIRNAATAVAARAPEGGLPRPEADLPAEGRDRAAPPPAGDVMVPAPPPGPAPHQIQIDIDGPPGGPGLRGPESHVQVLPLRTRLVGDVRPALLLLMGTVGAILLMACANVANLVLARTARRQREITVRAALGAGTARLVGHLLAESLVLGLAGGALGVALAYPLLALIVARIPAGVASGMFQQASVGLDAAVLAFAMGTSLATSLVFGLGPAILASRVDLNDTLREAGRHVSGGRRSRRLRTVLVVGEVALTAVLLVGAGLLVRSFERLLAVDPGFKPERVLTVALDLTPNRYPGPAAFRSFYTQAAERVRAIPGVSAVAFGDTVPLRDFTMVIMGLTVEGPGPRPDREPEVAVSAVSPDYFEAMGMHLAGGRAFTDADREGTAPVAVVNQHMAKRLWGTEQVVGRRIQIGPRRPDWITIVGVVADIRHDGLDAEARVAMYRPFLQEPTPFAYLVVRTASAPSAVLGDIRQAIGHLDSTLAVRDAATMEQRLADSVAARRFTLLLLSLFAGLGVTLASVGLYGVLSSSVAERTREIGIRMALGASPADVRRRVVGEGLLLAALGTVLGLGAARGLSPALSTSLFGIAPHDLATFTFIAGLLMTVAVAAVWIPAVRATRVDPIEALREE